MAKPRVHSSMEFRQRLGSGGFAEVFEGFFYGKPVAIKVMKSTKNPTATLEAFQAEARVFGLRHPHIIEVFAVEFDPTPVVVMERVPQAKSLQNLINGELFYPWRKYANQLVDAITYLHANNVLHLDLKPANVLVGENHLCKVIDFGCSQTASNPVFSTQQGTPAYRAPELFRGRLPTTKADVYSLAITLWSLKYQRVPYDGQHGDMLIYQVVAFQLRPSPDPEFQPLWHQDPLQRPEADQLRF